MADPVSAAMIGLQVAGKAFGASSKADAYKAQAKTDDANAQQALQQGAMEQLAIGRRLRAVQGDALVAEGMSGGSVGTGSALDALRQNAINAQFDVLNARASATSRANAYYADAHGRRVAAQQTATSGLIGAASSILGGFSQGGAGQQFGPTLPMPMSYSLSGGLPDPWGG